MSDRIEIKMLDMQVLSLKPGDVVVLRHPGKLSDIAFAIMRESIQPLFPDNKIMLLEEGASISVIRDDSTDDLK